jgi:hypothetical protein
VVRDIGAFLSTDDPTTELTEVQELLTQPHPSGRGVALLDGIWSLAADYNTMVLYVEMLPEATGVDPLLWTRVSAFSCGVVSVDIGRGPVS